jgi:hypothetical protein
MTLLGRNNLPVCCIVGNLFLLFLYIKQRDDKHKKKKRSGGVKNRVVSLNYSYDGF